MKRLIIDADPGNGIPGANIDDAFAIALALTHPDVELIGVTTVAGNVELEDATACALQLLEIADRTDVPVCRGAEQPLASDPTPFRMAVGARAADERVKQLWYGVPRPSPSSPADPRPAVDFLLETITSSPGEITLVTVGPLTNVASALQIEPDLASSVESIVMMAGAVRVPGTTTAATEL
ncbi:MAG: nucleoside hydrolase, partial [Chloroflexota bacterium]